jgi:adenine-specific DNA-methyltransferase
MNKNEKLPMRTPSLVDENFAVLAKLFPNAVTETVDENGAVVRAIDADVLAQEINTHVVSGREERYQFTWPDKKKSVLLANAPIAAALRPCREESVDFDNTENLYIEGDNLDVLKLLRETYLNRVKMIYIDPPYNTGKDFIYEDDFAVETGEFLRRDGQYDGQGNRLTPNLDSNGRFHTDWLNMIYPRLRVARDLLTDDGVIFISIDDNEVHNLRKVCDEIFGSTNILGQLVWKKKYTGGKHTSTFADYHEYIFVYAKSVSNVGEISMSRPNEEKGKFDLTDEYVNERGKYYIRPLKSNLDPRPTLVYPIELPDGTSITTQWICARDTYDQLLAEGRILLKKKNDGNYQVYKKYYERDGGGNVKIPSFLEIANNNEAKEELKSLFKIVQTRDLPFQTPKPTKLLSFLCKNFTDKGDIILDFFSGSGSTAHALMQINAENGDNRKFIMVQIPELCDEKSKAYKAGYKNICEIGKERIRRAGKKITEENKDKEGIENLDIGFRVLKLDSSNMKDVYYTPEEYAQLNFDIEGFMDNIKPDRSDEDLLFQVMLDLGIPLSAKIRKDGKMFYVNDNYLIACFGTVDTTLITEIAKKKPYYAVFRDSSFINDSAMVNFEQVFSTYSPNTIRRVL